MAAKLGVFTGSRAGGLAQFESWLGKPVDTVLGYTGGGNWAEMDPSWAITSGLLGREGKDINWSIPLVPYSNSGQWLKEAAAGQHDAKYREWAKDILTSRAGDSEPIYVRTAWELGGEWMSITAAANANPAAFKGAFQHFAQAFHDASPRFKIVFDTAGGRPSQEHLYPGDASVDVISQDIYWQTQYHGTDPVKAFEFYKSGMQQNLDWMTKFAANHGKPMAISEWGVPGSGTLDGTKFIDLMDNWIDTHNVVYANYWNDTAGSGYDGMVSDGAPAASGAALRAAWADRGGSTSAAPTDTLVLKVSQDAYNGSAQYTVKVDGKQIGGTFTASALHSLGQSDPLTLKGEWVPGMHKVEVQFLNDAWGGTTAKDRNLYIDGATIDGEAVPAARLSLFSSGTQSFSFTDKDQSMTSLTTEDYAFA